MANMRYAYLLFVSSENNHNKYYEMKQVSNDTWEASFGRVGANKSQHASYSMSVWDKKYYEKVNKGYRDRTKEHVGTGEDEVMAQGTVKTGRSKPIADKEINDLVMSLIAKSAQILKENYTIELNNVTVYMLDKAQEVLNKLNSISASGKKQGKISDRQLDSLNVIWQKILVALGRKIEIEGYIRNNYIPKKIVSAEDTKNAYYRGTYLADEAFRNQLISRTVYKNVGENLQLLVEEYKKINPGWSNSDSGSLREFNYNLVELFNILPRRMRKVEDYLARNVNDFDTILLREQNLYDTMKGAYESKKRKYELAAKSVGTSDKDVLEENGLRMRKCTPEEVAEIKNLLGEISGRFSRAWRVENITTSEKYKKCVHDLGIHQGGIKRLWHGSTTENWWSILTNGLTLNPNARVTGKMFGQGIYFAPKARKSLGYTSLRGSYWAGGSSNVGYMGVFTVACGKPYDVTRSSSDFYNFGFKDLRGGCTYVYAHAGQALRNDEIIIYKNEQLTIKYLVELK